jgi:hypothetical protein
MGLAVPSCVRTLRQFLTVTPKGSCLGGLPDLGRMAALTTRCGRRRLSFSVPRRSRGVHRPAAAALRSGAGVGGRAQLLSRGCGGAAAFDWEGPGVRPEVCARDCAAMCSFQAEHGPSIDHLPSHQRMVLLCVDPLLRRGSARFRVHLYW